MNRTIYSNVTGIGEFVYAVNLDSSGVLLSGIIFTFFIVLLISLFLRSRNSLYENFAVAGGLSLLPSAILSTQSFLGVSVIAVSIPIFFIFVIAFGIGGMYFTSK